MAVWAAPVEAKSKSKPQRGEVILLGSSSVLGALGHRIEHELEALGYAVRAHGRSSSGLARPDFFDWFSRAKTVPIGAQTRAALVYVGGNDAQGIRLRSDKERKRYKAKDRWLRWHHPAWARAYADRVQEFSRTLCRRGLHRVVFVTPVDVADAGLQRRLKRIRRAIRTGASRVRCATVVGSRGDAVGPRLERRRGAKRLRRPDGTHVTRVGAERLWRRIGARLVKAIAHQRQRKTSAVQRRSARRR
jgi:hypothetical protein